MKKEEVSADIGDILEYIIQLDEEIAECDARRVFFAISYANNCVTVELCKEYETIESELGNTDFIETKINKTQILSIKSNTQEYTNMLIDYIRNKDEYNYYYNEERVNSLYFIKIFN